MTLFKISFTHAFASAGALAFVVALSAPSAHAMGKKAIAGKSESQIEIGGLANDDLGMNAKLIVDAGTDGTADAAKAAVNLPAGPSTSAGDAGAMNPAIAAAGVTTTVGASAADVMAKPDIAKVPENQIPVLTGAKESKKSSANGFNRIMITLGVLAIALGAATFGLKRLASRRGKKNHGTKIKVLTTHALGPKKSIAIIQVAGESILVGITDHNISMLKTLALIDDEFPEDIPKHFDAALSGHDFEEDQFAELQAIKGRPNQRQNQISSRGADQDDFLMRGLTEIRDKVSTRLQNMKNL